MTRQRWCHVLVSSARELLQNDIGDLWDTGQIPPPEPPGLAYAGEPLQSFSRCFWKVRWADREGRTSPWSEPASFVTGFLAPGDWKPRWIAARRVREFRSKGTLLLGHQGEDDTQACAVYLRREFALEARVVLAMIFVSGLGHYELRLNGNKVGTSVLDPGWTDYRKKALYASHDVTALVRDRNAVGIILGNGRHTRAYGYEAPRLTCRIEIEYESGERQILFSDESWKTSAGPLEENGLYFGERYDARILIDGWDRPGYDDGTWEKAATVAGYPLVSQMMPPVRVTERLAPRSIERLPSGAFIVDFGQNFTGWVRLKAEGPMGAEIRLRHGELLDEDGTLNVGPNENAEATDVYVLRGGGPEVYEPRFTYHGFRYVEVTGYPGTPGPDAFEGAFVHSDVGRTGTFRSSNELVDAIHRNVVWGQLSNLMSIPTDCPQRDERHGWLGDAHLAAEEAVYNFDMAAFYVKFLDDIRLAQKEDGSLPDVVPPYLPRFYPADPAWSAAYAALLSLLWDHTGDLRLVSAHYAGLKKYVDYLGRNADRGIVRKLGKYGDWCPPGSVVPEENPGRPDLDLVLLPRHPRPRPAGRPPRPRRRGPGVLAAGRFGPDRVQRHVPRRIAVRGDPGQSGRRPSEPDLQPPPALPRHGPRRPNRAGAGEPAEKRRRPPGLPPRHGHPGHALPARRPDPERARRGRLPGRDAEKLSGLGLHDRRGRDDPLGEMGEARRTRHELPEPHHARERRRLVLPRPRRPLPRPAGMEEGPHPSPRSRGPKIRRGFA